MASARYLKRLLAISAVNAAMIFGMSPSMAQGLAIQELQVETTGILNNDERGEASNVVLDFHVGAGASITSLQWDVNVTSYPGSYLSEMQVTFSDSLGTGVTFTPGDEDDFDGTADYSGFQDLVELGLAFAVGADGILRLEFHDGFKDLAFDEPEGIWNSGTLTFGIAPVPEPAAVTMMLGGSLLLIYAARRRRS